MTDTAPPTPAPVPAPAPAPPAPVPVPAAPEQAPAGFVPQADLDRVEAQRRGFQSEAAAYKAQLAALQTPATPAPVGDTASELSALRTELAKDRQTAALSAHVPALQTEFPYADPYFFKPETLGEYDSVEAFRASVEADHARVAAIVIAAEAKKEADLKATLGGQSPLGPVAPPTPGVDPTVQQLNALSPTQLDAFEKANPGVAQRVIEAAMAAAG